MFKVSTFILFFTLSCHALTAQKNASYYLFDAELNGVQDQKKAVYFARQLKESDTCWTWDFYHFAGPKIKRIQYKDEQQSIVHGKLLFYNDKGYFDSTGYATNNLRDGHWYFYDDTGRAVLKKEYLKGILQVTEDLTTRVRDTTKYGDEKESEFPGGLKKWQQYLSKNLQYPERAQNAKVMGIVILQFIVDTKGNVSDLDICKSLEFSIDEEATRLIRDSPKWVPAFQNGKIVKSYKKQPLHFRLQ